jgi:hypothetical protein
MHRKLNRNCHDLSKTKLYGIAPRSAGHAAPLSLSLVTVQYHTEKRGCAFPQALLGGPKHIKGSHTKFSQKNYRELRRMVI